LPALPDPVVGDTGDEDWLFDSRRDYMEQLQRYKTPEEQERMMAVIHARNKACQQCGGHFVSRHKDTMYCSRTCRVRAHRAKKREAKRL
jgi:ribosomal protein S27AE